MMTIASREIFKSQTEIGNAAAVTIDPSEIRRERKHDHDKDDNRDEHREWAETKKCSESGGDPFASAKFEPDREHVSGDGEERGSGHHFAKVRLASQRQKSWQQTRRREILSQRRGGV